MLSPSLYHQVKMEDHLKEGLTPVYSFADRSVAIGARPEHYEIIAEVLPIALEVSDLLLSLLRG